MRRPTFTEVLRRQDGISLIMAIGVLSVLSMTGVTLISYSSSNARSAEYSLDNNSAYALAEAGINEMMAVLSKPTNNALTPTLLPRTTRTSSSGTLTWFGSLDFATATWSITSTGALKNPTGAAQDVTRTLTAKVPITPTYAQPLNNPAWDFIYATQTGNACDVTLANNVSGAARLLVEGNLCLSPNAKLSVSAAVVKGNLDISNNGAIGTSTARVETYVGGNCRYQSFANGAWATPCVGRQDQRNIFAKRLVNGQWENGVSNTVPLITRPTADFTQWYERAVPGPRSVCTSANGARSGAVPVFENETVNATRNNSVPTAVDLTPTSSYTCRVGPPSAPAGELSWNATTRTLKILGTIYVDGSAKIANGQLNQYDGQGTIYLSGTLYINGKMCGGVSGSNCDFASWNPNTEMLMFVTEGTGGLAGAGNGVAVDQNGQFQGGLFANGAIQFFNNAHAHGPLVGSTVIFVNNVWVYSFPTIASVPVGMPSNPQVYAQPNPPQMYSG